jgi:hypothetical protein
MTLCAANILGLCYSSLHYACFPRGVPLALTRSTRSLLLASVSIHCCPHLIAIMATLPQARGFPVPTSGPRPSTPSQARPPRPFLPFVLYSISKASSSTRDTRSIIIVPSATSKAHHSPIRRPQHSVTQAPKHHHTRTAKPYCTFCANCVTLDFIMS